MNAWEKFRNFITENGLVSAGDRIILAVSGGPDSVCLAHLFWRLRKTVPLELCIVNMDHGLRRESAKEARKVQKLGKKLGIQVIVRKIHVRKASREGKISLETAGRNLRYEALFSAAAGSGFNKIATGHTADDNAETVLMWLIRGTGSEGLAGIPPERKGKDGTAVIRPMLPVSRAEVMAYVKEQGLDYSIDSSNLGTDFTRNRIRHKVIPLLKGFNPKFVEHIFNLSGIIALENEFLSEAAGRAARKLGLASGNTISIDLKRFFEYNEAVKYRILKSVLPEKRSLGSVKKLVGFIQSENREELILSKSWRVEKKRGRLFFRRINSAKR